MGEAINTGSWQAYDVIAPPIPLVWAKLQPPMPPPQSVLRSDLVDELVQSDAVLTAIVAPAGFGKTTTAMQLVRALGGRVAWVSLERADSNPARFWTYVAAALSAAGVNGADRTYQYLADDGVDAATLTLRVAIEASTEPVVLVLDDLHSIESSEVDQQLSEWLRRPIANLRLVCTSRSDLPLPVGRLRSQGQLVEMRAERLAFTQSESASLLRTAFGIADLSVEQLETLDTRTQGWPVGLYLAGLTLRDDPDIDRQLERFAGDTRHLNEYLAVEAMDGVSPDVRAFALTTSIVTVLDPDLCDALTGQIGSLKILRGLVADNVFTSALDPAGMIFHYHPLFREHLQSALAAEHPDLIVDLHKRASAWYESRGELDEAIVHATAAGSIDRAEQLITSTMFKFANAGHFDTVSTWIDALGDPSRLSCETSLLMSWTMLNLRRYDDLDHWVALAESVAQSDLDQQMTRLQIPAIRAHQARHSGDVGLMVRLGNTALEQAKDYPDSHGVESMVASSLAGRGAALSAIGCGSFWAGDVDESRDNLLESLAIARTTNMVIEIIFAYGYLAMIEADAGDAQAALAHADHALALIAPGDERHHQPTLPHLARSIALLLEGRPGDAQDALARAVEMSTVRPEPLHDAAVALQAARLAHRIGDTENARASMRSAKAIVARMPDPRFDARIRAVEAEIRFVPRDVEGLPAGGRELTDREQAVLALLPHGLARKELALQLHVSENTIKTHLTSIRHKLGVGGRGSIVDRANELGLLGPAES